MTEYVLHVVNQSDEVVDLAVFQRMPGSNVRDVFSPAWLAGPFAPPRAHLQVRS